MMMKGNDSRSPALARLPRTILWILLVISFILFAIAFFPQHEHPRGNVAYYTIAPLVILVSSFFLINSVRLSGVLLFFAGSIIMIIGFLTRYVYCKKGYPDASPLNLCFATNETLLQYLFIVLPFILIVFSFFLLIAYKKYRK